MANGFDRFIFFYFSLCTCSAPKGGLRSIQMVRYIISEYCSFTTLSSNFWDLSEVAPCRCSPISNRGKSRLFPEIERYALRTSGRNYTVLRKWSGGCGIPPLVDSGPCVARLLSSDWASTSWKTRCGDDTRDARWYVAARVARGSMDSGLLHYCCLQSHSGHYVSRLQEEYQNR